MAPRCFVTDGGSNELVNTMMTHIQSISDAAFESLKHSYENELDKLKTVKEAWDQVENEYRLEKNDEGDEREMNDEVVEGDKKKLTNPFKTLMGQLFGWLQLPVIGFDSEKYDINVIKRLFIPYLLTPSEDEDESCFVIKRLNAFMCFSTTKLRFLVVVNYLAPGFIYDKYLKAYGCTVQKGHFPYEYIDDLRKLEERSLPPHATFYSRLKNKGITDEDYAL